MAGTVLEKKVILWQTAVEAAEDVGGYAIDDETGEVLY